MKILNTIGTKFNQEARSILSSTGEVVDSPDIALDLIYTGLKKEIGKYEVLLVALNLKIDKHIIDAGKDLKLIATPTTGLDHIDVDYAKEKGIKVLSLQDEDLRHVTGTAEHALFLMGALIRKIPLAFDDVKQGGWNREKFVGHNLFGKTLGIVGLGRLGSMMAQYGKALGMKVIAHDPRQTDSEFELVDFYPLLQESDIILIHTTFTPKTKDMFDKQAFGEMKNGAYLINTARGGIVNESDLLEALRTKKIAGYATDVLADEINWGLGLRALPELIKYANENDNVIITPHIGGMTEESRAATDIIIAKKVAQYFSQ